MPKVVDAQSNGTYGPFFTSGHTSVEVSGTFDSATVTMNRRESGSTHNWTPVKDGTWTAAEAREYTGWKADLQYVISGGGLTYDVDGIGGKPSILSDGIDDLMVLAQNALTSSAGLIFIVFKATSNADNDYVFSSSDEATTTRHVAFGQMSSEYGITQNNGGTADTVDGDTATDTDATILMIASNGTAYELRVNGNAETESADSGSNSGDWFGDVSGIDNVVLGALKTTSEGNHFPGRIAEIIVYSEDKSNDEKSKIQNYLSSRYGIGLT